MRATPLARQIVRHFGSSAARGIVIADTRSVTEVLYVGHATVFVDLDGVKLLTDPMLRTRVAHLRRRSRVDMAALRHVDVVLVSHAHHDHLDLPSLDRLDRGVQVVVPKGVGYLLSKRGLTNVVEVEEGDEVQLGTVTVATTHAVHDGCRRPGRAEGPALGYAISGSRRIYFAGDTALFPEMEGLVSDLDLALVPIWGWGSTLGRGRHLDPASAAKALSLLRPRVAVPIHWGTNRPLWRGLLSDPSFLSEPATVFEREVERVAPDVEVRVLGPGDRLTLERSAG